MYSANKFPALLLIIAMFVSCRKEEIVILPMDRGNVITAQVDMGNDYRQQIFYSLTQNTIVSSNMKTDWDLAFETSPAGNHIKLNSAKWMSAFNTGQTDFNLASDTTGFTLNTKYDVPSGNLDSTAIGNWQFSNAVYILDRGYTNTGSKVGFKKLQILAADANSFTIRYANLNGTNTQTLTIIKQADKNFTCFSMNSNSVVNIEPDKKLYDIVFTQYTHIYHDPQQSYLVVGMLTNPDKVRSACITSISFDQIRLSDTLSHPLKNNIDNIGFDWKTYDLNTGTYTVNPNLSYIIKGHDGFFYKLHFIGFYNSSGLKGSPKFEFHKL